MSEMKLYVDTTIPPVNDSVVGMTKPFPGATEFRAIPTLPDVMEDGYVVMECRGGELIVRIVSAFRAPSYPVYRLMVLDGDGYSEYDVDGIAQEIGSLPSLAPYHVQDGKIVRREG